MEKGGFLIRWKRAGVRKRAFHNAQPASNPSMVVAVSIATHVNAVVLLGYLPKNSACAFFNRSLYNNVVFPAPSSPSSRTLYFTSLLDPPPMFFIGAYCASLMESIDGNRCEGGMMDGLEVF
jgi:hypothetical protein